MKGGTYYVYILTNFRKGTLYVGVTNSLLRRIYEHKNGGIEGFAKKYGIKILVYYETYQDIRNAISREKQMKKWNRDWKIKIIENSNPEWRDLYEELYPIE